MVKTTSVILHNTILTKKQKGNERKMSQRLSTTPLSLRDELYGQLLLQSRMDPLPDWYKFWSSNKEIGMVKIQDTLVGLIITLNADEKHQTSYQLIFIAPYIEFNQSAKVEYQGIKVKMVQSSKEPYHTMSCSTEGVVDSKVNAEASVASAPATVAATVSSTIIDVKGDVSM